MTTRPITKEHLETLSKQLDQAREKAGWAHEAWYLTVQSRKALIDSLLAGGSTYASAAAEADKVFESNGDAHAAAVHDMTRAEKQFVDALRQHNAQNAQLDAP